MKHFNIPRATINSWKKIEEELILFRTKNHLTIHKGTQPKFIDIENKLYEFFEFNRALSNGVTIKAILL